MSNLLLRGAVLALLAVGGAGCVTTDALARTRASHEFLCPEEKVALTPRPELSEGTYDADACGHHARYTCIVDTDDGMFPVTQTCVREPIGDAKI